MAPGGKQGKMIKPLEETSQFVEKKGLNRVKDKLLRSASNADLTDRRESSRERVVTDPQMKVGKKRASSEVDMESKKARTMTETVTRSDLATCDSASSKRDSTDISRDSIKNPTLGKDKPLEKKKSKKNCQVVGDIRNYLAPVPSTSSSCIVSPRATVPTASKNVSKSKVESSDDEDDDTVELHVKKTPVEKANSMKRNKVSNGKERDVSSGSSEDDSDTDGKSSDEYEVEFIKDYKGKEYFVKWKGWDKPEDDTWEPRENLFNCDEALRTFFLTRLAEVKSIRGKYAGDQEELSKALRKRQLPPDPRSLEQRMEAFFKEFRKPTEKELLDVLKTLANNTQNKWQDSKVDRFLLDAFLGKLNDDEIKLLRSELIYRDAKGKQEKVAKPLKEWEKSLNKTTKGKPCITVENFHDFTGPPQDFKYINTYIAGNGVTIPDDPCVFCSCECGEGGACVRHKNCMRVHSDDGKESSFNYSVAKRMLRPVGVPIYECNKNCKCGPDCTNRVVQDGIEGLAGLQYCIFRNMMGWGVKTLKPIKRGSFVSLYVGEIIQNEEAEKRGEAYDNEGKTYLFDLDLNGTDNAYTVDAKYVGNISHFFNHSCDPNLSVYNIFVNCLDGDLPLLALFANRDISKGEELTFDYYANKTDEYDTKSDDTKSDDNKGSPSKFLTKCLCGSKNCRGFLFKM